MKQIETETNGSKDQEMVGTGNDNPPVSETQGNEAFLLPLAIDGTSTQEFSIVDNTKYSQRIIETARAAYDLERLAELRRGSSLDEFLAESKRQILSQWHGDMSLGAHSNLYRVLFHINVGLILKEVEPTFEKKAAYMKWLRANFGVKHLRYLQQAKELAAMGEFAREHAAAGKNRLLVLYSLMKLEQRSECIALFNEHPLPDLTDDENGQVLKNHVDAVITLHRFHNAGIGFISFDQAAIIGSLSNEAVTVQKVEQVKTWLNSQAEGDRPALFDRYVQDHMIYPSEHPFIPSPRASLNKILSEFLNCCRIGDTEGDGWIERQRTLVDMATLASAQRYINELMDKIARSASVDEPVTENNH
ncbi:MAG: hypothetical protein M0P30_05400 [Syntrophorhabdaceae bacterium]|nr:hypothetical protein [Syntrophorhabdaceae bacterium]